MAIDISLHEAVQNISPEKIKETIKEVVKIKEVYINQPVTASVTLEHALAEGSPFPEAWPGPAPEGVVSGGNGLVRSQYVNGTALTAATLQREQRYLDARARLVAQALPAGVAWGLPLRVPGRPPAPDAPLSGGTAVDLDADTVMGAGLAFDGAGRPIAVGGDFSFPFRRLLAAAAARPLEVSGGGTSFAPCVCLRPSSSAAVGGADLAGPWLLVIQPEERPQGEAKVYGVSTTAPLGCVADGWRGGFGLSLARLPLDIRSLEVRDVWALRGELVAWLFDTWERQLTDRWEGQTPAREAPEGDPPLASAVPLALICIATDGSVLFCDRWAPRRPLVESAPAASARAALGSETLARALARRRQFQGMLAESLYVQPMDFGGAPSRPQDLYSRGFRHLPPSGVLPVPIPARTNQDPLTHARETLSAAAAYFRGTNVVIGDEIALTEDLLHAEIDAAAGLDPIVMSMERVPTSGTSLDPWVQQPALRRFGQTILARGITLEQLTRGEVVLVRLIAALHNGSSGVGAQPLVAFARQPLSLALDLPPPPPPPQSVNNTLTGLTIDSPPEGSVLWAGDATSFRWTTQGGSGALTVSATLAGASSQAWGQSLPPTQSQSLIISADGASGSGVIGSSYAGPVTLTVTATDATTSRSATRAYQVRRRTLSVSAPSEGLTVANDASVKLVWSAAEGWEVSSQTITFSFEGIRANTSTFDRTSDLVLMEGTFDGTFSARSGRVVLEGEPANKTGEVVRDLAGGTREREVSLVSLFGADNHLVGRLTFNIRATGPADRSVTTSVSVQLQEPGTEINSARLDFNRSMEGRMAPWRVR